MFNRSLLNQSVGVFVVLVSAFMIWYHHFGGGGGAGAVEGFAGEGGDDGRVNLVAEQGHFRQRLDLLDRQAAADPKNADLAEQRQNLEAVLTEIADFIQREGKLVDGETAERLVEKIRGDLL